MYKCGNGSGELPWLQLEQKPMSQEKCSASKWNPETSFWHDYIIANLEDSKLCFTSNSSNRQNVLTGADIVRLANLLFLI